MKAAFISAAEPHLVPRSWTEQNHPNQRLLCVFCYYYSSELVYTVVPHIVEERCRGSRKEEGFVSSRVDR